jgi:pimeloyl-ACP methyl ester carboxylesterase
MPCLWNPEGWECVAAPSDCQVLLLPACRRAWRRVQEHLAHAAGIRVVSFDRPGCGLTEGSFPAAAGSAAESVQGCPPEAVRGDAAAAWDGEGWRVVSEGGVVLRLCAGLGLQRVVLVGHDDGCWVALAAAAAAGRQQQHHQHHHQQQHAQQPQPQPLPLAAADIAWLTAAGPPATTQAVVRVQDALPISAPPASPGPTEAAAAGVGPGSAGAGASAEAGTAPPPPRPSGPHGDQAAAGAAVPLRGPEVAAASRGAWMAPGAAAASGCSSSGRARALPVVVQAAALLHPVLAGAGAAGWVSRVGRGVRRLFGAAQSSEEEPLWEQVAPVLRGVQQLAAVLVTGEFFRGWDGVQRPAAHPTHDSVAP